MKAMQDLRLFAETARLGSLSAAARSMNLSPAAVSAAVKRLEQELEVELFVRTTRKLRLTQEGDAFLIHCQQALDLIDKAVNEVRQHQRELSGTLNLSMPSDLGRNLVLPLLDGFLVQHPKLQLRLSLSDRIEDLYSSAIDLVLRYGPLADSSMVALPLVEDNYRVLVASPEYLEQQGRPQHPKELARHQCLCFSLADGLHDQWVLINGQEKLLITAKGTRTANDGEVVHRWALAGQGIALKSLLDVAADLDSGRLVRLCHDWCSEPVPLNLLCASRAQLSPAVQALRDYLRQALGETISNY